MNIYKVTQYASKIYQEGKKKYGNDVTWRGRTEEGKAVGALDIAIDMAKQHTSEDDEIINSTISLIDKLSKSCYIDHYYDNNENSGRILEYNKESMENAANWIKTRVITPAINDLGYHIVAEILKEAATLIRDRFKEIIRITYDEEVNFEFYSVTNETSERNGESIEATDWLISLFNSSATPIYNSFVQLRGLMTY